LSLISGTHDVRRRVLVVDDHADTVLLFVEELLAEGYDAVGATDPNEALSLALTRKPDVVVIDIAMPDMDGYELARLVRSYAPTRAIRLVAVSAHAFDFSQPQLPPGGWDAHARKPVEPGTLAGLVRHVLGAAPAATADGPPLPRRTPPR
jgi:CheY-like chemotaxis protein